MLVNTPILMYHSVYKDVPHRGGISSDRLRSHFEILNDKGWRGVSIDVHRENPGPRDICLTFDDGYVNNLEFALPLLEEYGFKATIFVLVKPGVKHLQWHDSSPQPLMTEQHWRSWDEHGQEVASHGLTHAELTNLGTENVKKELVHSKAILEDTLGKAVSGYAYPQGTFDASSLKAVANVYKYACATRYRFPFGESLYRLRRIGINDYDDNKRFTIKLSLPIRLAFDLGV